MIETKYFRTHHPDLYKKALRFDEMTEGEIYQYFKNSHSFFHLSAIDDIKCSSTQSGLDIGPTEGVPTFRGFILALIDLKLSCKGDLTCLKDLDVHIRSQFDRCLPCRLQYQVILKVRSCLLLREYRIPCIINIEGRTNLFSLRTLIVFILKIQFKNKT